MDYGSLIGDAWRMTWRHRFLWVLGLFAGGASGLSFGNGGGGDFSSVFDGAGNGSRGRSGSGGSVDAGFAEAGRWLGEHVWLIILGVLLLVLIGLVLFALSFVAQGGLAGASADLGSGRPSSFRSAVRTGQRLFWRYVGLWLVLVAFGLAFLLVLAGVVGSIVLLTMAVEQKAWVIIPSVLFGIVLFIVGVIFAVVAGIVVAFAKRAIPVLDIGPLAALAEGWRVMRARPGTALLVWLLDLALGFGTSIVVAIVALFLLLVLAMPVLIAWFGLKMDGSAMLYPAIGYGVVAGVLWFAVLLFLSAVVNTFHWNYWTLAYLRLRLDPAENVAQVTPT